MARPRFQPTTANRLLVKTLSAYGIPQDQIARHIGLRSAKTLRRHFRRELDRGAIEAYAKVAQTAFQLATSGKHPSATFDWLRKFGWHSPSDTRPQTAATPPFVVSREQD